MKSQRLVSIVALLLLVASFGVLVWSASRNFPRGLIVLVLLVAAFATGWEGMWRQGTSRRVLTVAAGVLLAAAVVALVAGGILAEALVAVVLFALATMAAREAFRMHVQLPTAPPPKRPVVVWNPRSGGGKASKAHLDEAARERGIESIELRPGDDLIQLVRDAVARGADALAAAGGDGTQALVATIAAELDLPFACIPAGTRNHFALDLGVDRDDVVGALDAFVRGGERRVDLAEVNGRVFVNNVSLGLYAEAVQSEGYRDAKLKTMLDTVPAFASPTAANDHELRYTGSDDVPGRRAIVALVSNNAYRLGKVLGSGTRPRLDDGVLGISVLSALTAGAHRLEWREWQAPEFVVDSDGPVPAGVDGEALVFDPPLRFSVRQGALRVRIAPHHPGASPSAAAPNGLIDAVRRLTRIAVSGHPEPT